MKKLISEEAAQKANLNSKELNNLVTTAKAAAEKGGKILMKFYGDLNSIKDKGRVGDLLTNADLESEAEIVNFLEKETPKIGILAEEGGSSGPKTELNWVIDPLDGTTNFAHGYPFFATSIGLTFNDEPILGSISVPYMKEIYWAAPTIGSYCNNKSNQVSNPKKLINSLLVTGFAYDRFTEVDNNYSEFCWLTHRTRGVRRGGAAAVDMAFVASGKIDGYWERGLAKWDLAAGVPIVELAGGIVSDYKSNKFNLCNGRILACNRSLEKEFKAELNKVKPLDKKIYDA